jgi:5-methylcytosine-specific restriction endonuclease McrA
MPIRPENKARYPKDWPQISRAVRDDAGNQCEQCKAPNGEVIARGTGGDAGTYMLRDGRVFDADTGAHLGMARGSEYECRMVKIVLTVAHLNHQPEDNRRENLKALCQRCHLQYDAKSKVERRRERARDSKACGELF